jgi:hypothetical protein
MVAMMPQAKEPPQRRSICESARPEVDAARARRFSRGVRAILLACPLVLAGCFAPSGASSNAIPMVKVQAEGDLDCPQKEIRVTKEWGGRFEAIGCGHKKVYNTACEGLKCTVAPEGESVPWRSRPDPLLNPDIRP